MSSLIYRYWGKAKRDKNSGGPDYHLLPYHSLDVAAVAWVLLDPEGLLCQALARRLGVDPSWLRDWFVFCLMLHDLGKFFRAFQNLAPNLSEHLVPYFGHCVYEKRHDTLGFVLWQKKLSKALADIFPAETQRQVEGWLEITCGHHGQPPEIIREYRSFLLEEDEQAAEAFVREVFALWPVDLTPLTSINKHDIRNVSWQLAGIAVLADWLGSNQDIFQYVDQEMPLDTYWKKFASVRAVDAVKVTQLGHREISTFTSIGQQFDFISDDSATPLQRFAQTVALGNGPQLFILEDVTGAGKTEAAMVLVHRLMSAGLASGFYVGLPTMATANAMYERMARSYRNLYAEGEMPSLVLSHGARELSQAFTDSVLLAEQKGDRNYEKGEFSASAYCNQWLADSRKKALLADVGVGTIDQALLGILPARHQALRLLGLTGKILLVDEVHAFDPYMRQLLSTLLQAHAAQGGSAILLSATLPYHFRCELTAAYAKGAGYVTRPPQNQRDYPLVTHLFGTAALNETPIPTRDSVKRQVKVVRLSGDSEAMEVIRCAVEQGQCICWIRNTVKDARQTYEQLAEQHWIDPQKLTLFHSRFAMIDRQVIEKDVLGRFGKKSGQRERAGQVLIATQVVEQSLDLDFDVMISDLAPIDLLIQRAGRLQRHLRDTCGNLLAGSKNDERPSPCLHVLAPDPELVADKNWLRTLLPGTQAVYSHVGQLWLTLSAVLKHNGFAMPEDARRLIESVYAESVQQDIPPELERASSEAHAKQRAMQGMGQFNCLKLEKGYTRSSAGHNGGWDEEVHIPTRLGDDTVTVALARLEDGELLPYAQNEHRKSAWALSQISLPKTDWENASKRMPSSLKQQIEALKENTPALRWVEVLPLVEQTQSLYSAESGWNSIDK